MPKMMLEEAKEFGVLPDETLILIEVQDIRERNVTPKGGGEGWTKLEFKCVIRDIPDRFKGDEEYMELIGSNIWGSTSNRFTTHPDNKLRRWSEALLNMGELDAGFELDTDLLIGRQAKAVTGSYVRNDGSRRHQIDDMLPAGPLGGTANIPAGLFKDDAPSQQPTSVQTAVQSQPQVPAPSTQVPAWAVADDDPPF